MKSLTQHWSRITSAAVLGTSAVAPRVNQRVQNKLLKRKLHQGNQRPMAKILLAEDDATMVSLLKTLLKMEGFEVLALDVDSDVSAAVQREKPDALFMDVHLGSQSGIDILKTIRKNKDIANIRVVMTSGLDMQEECLRRGANAFLLKPFMPDDLIRLLKP